MWEAECEAALAADGGDMPDELMGLNFDAGGARFSSFSGVCLRFVGAGRRILSRRHVWPRRTPREILSLLSPSGQLMAVDKDPAAEASAKALADDSRFKFVAGSFADISGFVSDGSLDGILLDLVFLHRSLMTRRVVSGLTATAPSICEWILAAG